MRARKRPRSRSPSPRRNRSPPPKRERKDQSRKLDEGKLPTSNQPPDQPVTDSTLYTAANGGNEEDKQRMKLARLEAWKRQKKQDQSARLVNADSPKSASQAPSSAHPVPPSPSSKTRKARQPPTSPATTASVASPTTSIGVTNGTTKPEPFKKITGFKLKQAPVQPVTKRMTLLGDDEDELKVLPKAKLIEFDPITDDGPAQDDEDTELLDAPVASANKDDEDAEIDPLDAYMVGIEAEVANPHKSAVKKGDLFDNDDDPRDIADSSMKDLLSIQGKKKKKEVPAIDWEKQDLEPFEKNFFRATAQISKEEVDALLSREHIKIKAYTKLPVPQPVTNWTFGFPSHVLSIIENLHYQAPTPIQSVAMPALMSGRDAICIAQTGSGKTIAYMLPLIRVVLHAPRLTSSENGPIALVVAPTRELALQVSAQAKPFTKQLGFRVVVAYGGQSIADQIADIKRGCHILVGTPGRLIELLSIRKLSLKQCRALIIDEADRCLDMGFQPQLDRITTSIRPDRMTALFSATFNDKMQTLAQKFIKYDPIEIIVGGRSTIPEQVEVHVEIVKKEDKLRKLLYVLGQLFGIDEDARCLIFVERQEAADDLLNTLMKKGYPCDSIHGNRDQADRASAITDFRNGALPVLIATSVAARGLDILQLKLVVNYDVPNHAEDFVHRIGRTGRAGRPGAGWVFIEPEQDNYATDLVKVLKESKKPIPEDLRKMSENFLEKVRAGKAKLGGGGFGGKGLDHIEELRKAERNNQRKAFGGEDEEETEEDRAKKAEEDEKKTQAILRKAAGTEVKPAADGSAATGTQADKQPTLDESRFKYTVHKTERPAENGQVSAKDRLAVASAGIQDRLSRRNQLRPGQPIDNKGPDAGAYHATLEINDFSQKARWSATNRSNIVKLLESGRVSITNKGTYFKPGAEPDPSKGEMKLYILVEGDSEPDVMFAMNHLVDLLKSGEEQELAAANAKGTVGGRYSVI